MGRPSPSVALPRPVMNQLILPLWPQALEHPHTCCTSDSYSIAGLGQTLVFWQDGPVQKDGLSILLDGVCSTQSMKIGASVGKACGPTFEDPTPLSTLSDQPQPLAASFPPTFQRSPRAFPVPQSAGGKPRPLPPGPAWNCVKCPWDCGDLGYSPEIAALPLPMVGSGLACACGLPSWSQPIAGGALQPTHWGCTWGTVHDFMCITESLLSWHNVQGHPIVTHRYRREHDP